jgi:hypothetical protein
VQRVEVEEAGERGDDAAVVVSLAVRCVGPPAYPIFSRDGKMGPHVAGCGCGSRITAQGG